VIPFATLNEIEPRDLGMPARFPSWRPGQLPALYRTAASPHRFIAQCAPTGFGKSPYAVACALLFGVRCCILTSTKILQQQYLNDFAECGITDIRGRHNYPCPIAKGATCSDGRILGCKNIECPRTLALIRAKESQLVITNYACYMHSYAHGEGLGEFGMLVLDEAHGIADELCSFLEITIDHAQNEYIYGMLSHPPPHAQPLKSWIDWAAASMPEARSHLDSLKEQSASLLVIREADRFLDTISKLAVIGEDWILDEQPGVSCTFAPLWPTEHAEQLLYRNIPKILLLSATIVRKSLDIIGVASSDREFLEQSHTFDPNRAPVYLFGPSRIDYRSTEGQLAEWIGRMDMLISRRLDRKALIHTISYARQKEIVSRSQYAHFILAPASHTLNTAIEVFRQSSPPKLLSSPALTTGYDFPFRDAEYQFIMKMPFIDGRGAILKARAASDPDYLPYLTAQILVQMCGRIMRAPKDRGETIILDAHANWFTRKHRNLLPSWFSRQLRYPDGPPIPPPALTDADVTVT